MHTEYTNTLWKQTSSLLNSVSGVQEKSVYKLGRAKHIHVSPTWAVGEGKATVADLERVKGKPGFVLE